MRAGRWTLLAVSVLVGACGPSGSGGGNDNGLTDGGTGNQNRRDGTVYWWDGTGPRDAAPPNWDAFFLEDPPPAYCGPDDATPPPFPGGTPDCPDDKNREGCGCTVPDAQAACWPGLRVDRNRGICHDGVTTCIQDNEFGGRWGPCTGYQLPEPGATLGPEACNCFSAGRWAIDNLSPCFVTYSGNQVYAVSTFMNGGQAQCPTNPGSTPPPAPEPGTTWSADRLQVDCAGQFQLCYTLRAGDEAAPLTTDCEVVSVCVDVWYDTPGVELELPPLAAWTSSNPACAAAFVDGGGYGEMSVLGTSIECDPISDGSDFYVFHRIGYCPMICNTQPTLPECASCGNGGSGSF